MKQLLAAITMSLIISLSGMAVAGEPVKLDDSQMDKVTAGQTIPPVLLTNPTTFLLLTFLGGALGFQPLIATSGGPSGVTVITGPGTVGVTATVRAGS
jgi:hypothetical protein